MTQIQMRRRRDVANPSRKNTGEACKPQVRIYITWVTLVQRVGWLLGPSHFWSVSARAFVFHLILSFIVLSFPLGTAWSAESLLKLPESTEAGWDLCKVIDKGIAKIPPDTALNTWPRKLRFPGLRRVAWTKLNPSLRMDLLEQGYLKLFDFSNTKTETEKSLYWQSEQKLVEDRIRRGKILLESATTDISGDGKITTLYRMTKPTLFLGTIRHYYIGPLVSEGWMYLIHNTEIDPDLHDVFVQFSDANNWDAFDYHGRTWFISTGIHSFLAEFYISRLRQVTFSAECEFNFAN
jgi:hypothetical protein